MIGLDKCPAEVQIHYVDCNWLFSTSTIPVRGNEANPTLLQTHHALWWFQGFARVLFSVQVFFHSTSPACLFPLFRYHLLAVALFLNSGHNYFPKTLYTQYHVPVVCLCLLSSLSSRMSYVLFNKCMMTLTSPWCLVTITFFPKYSYITHAKIQSKTCNVVSKYQFPLKRTRAPWRNGWFQV